MVTLPVRRTGRPPKVSTEAILDAAALIPAEQLTMTALADTLGISVKTIYYYFPNRAALLRSLTERAVAALEPLDLDHCDDWRDAMRLVGRWTYITLYERPFWELEDAGTRSAALRQVMMPCIHVLRAQGFDDLDAMGAMLLVTNFAAAQAAGAGRTARQSAHDVPALVPQDAAEEAMFLAMSSRSMDEWFEIGLDAAIAGVEVSFAPHRRRRRP